MSRAVLTVTPCDSGLVVRVVGGDEVVMQPDAARQLAALLLVQAEQIDDASAVATSNRIDERCANGCEREAELGGLCGACVHA